MLPNKPPSTQPSSPAQPAALQELHTLSVHYLFNAQLVPGFSPKLFDVAQAQGAENRLGRGTAYVFEFEGVEAVVRHCMRGGLMRFLTKDSYLYAGYQNTRMWRETLLLAVMHAKGLPVPIPVAARCQVIAGLFYKGDLVTQKIPNAKTLAEHLQTAALSDGVWFEIGKVIAKFHQNGIDHADLNANNIMLDGDHRVYLIDFDKAVQKIPAPAWQQENTQRLLRSLHKQKQLLPSFHFVDAHWLQLERGYTQGLQPVSKP